MNSVSYCVQCMGRKHHVQRTLSENLNQIKDKDAEIVLLDYNSPDQLGEYIIDRHSDDIRSGKLVYYRTEEPVLYRPAHAKNIAHKLGSKNILCNLDADNYLVDKFHDTIANIVREGVAMYPEICNNFCGRIAVWKSDFYKIGGYNEEFEDNWGWEDLDFERRLEGIGVKPIKLRSDSAFNKAIVHTDEERFKYCRIKHVGLSCLKNERLSNANLAAGIYVANQNKEYGKATVIKNFHNIIYV